MAHFAKVHDGSPSHYTYTYLFSRGSITPSTCPLLSCSFRIHCPLLRRAPSYLHEMWRIGMRPLLADEEGGCTALIKCLRSSSRGALIRHRAGFLAKFYRHSAASGGSLSTPFGLP